MRTRWSTPLKQPTPYFVDVTSMWVYAPVQQATVDANGDKWSTAADTYVSNGPFKVAEINMGESVVLERNENYWDAGECDPGEADLPLHSGSVHSPHRL